MEKDDHIINVWFRLRDEMLSGGGEGPSAIRPPSLREACYACALSERTATDTTPQVIESYINGLELGAMAALRDAWDKRHD